MTGSRAAQLKQASEGLLFLTETDAPFEVIHWPAQGKLTPALLLQLTNYPPDALYQFHKIVLQLVEVPFVN
jgi:hypothetical protein